MTPQRIQQRRTRGWRKPENTVSVARPGRWGNPYQIQAVRARGPFDVWLGGWFCGQSTDEAGARRIAVDRFRRAILAGHHGLSVVEAREQLAGKNLMCFCPLDQPCHADVLLELANPAPVCPECRDGKCRNCVGEALTGDDELVPCGCPNHKETTC